MDGVKCSFQEQRKYEPRGCNNRGYSEPYWPGVPQQEALRHTRHLARQLLSLQALSHDLVGTKFAHQARVYVLKGFKAEREEARMRVVASVLEVGEDAR